jgi:hypothetical protein
MKHRQGETGCFVRAVPSENNLRCQTNQVLADENFNFEIGRNVRLVMNIEDENTDIPSYNIPPKTV